MSQTFGPYNSSSTPSISAGTVTGIGVNQDAAAVRISNQSLTNDLLVSFAASQPPTVTTVGGGPNWPVVLHPGDRITCTLQNADKTPTALGQFWAGKVWLLPISNASLMAQTGGVPSLSNVWISTYQAGEPIPPTDPGPLTTNHTGQQRVVAIPIAAQARTNIWAPVNSGDSQVVFDTSITAAQQKNGILYAYLYGIQLTAAATPATSGGDFSLQVGLINAANAFVSGPFDLYRIACFWVVDTAVGIAPAPPAPAWTPFCAAYKFFSDLSTGNPVKVRFQMKSNTAPLGTPSILWTALVDVDTSNAYSPGNIGAFTPSSGLF